MNFSVEYSSFCGARLGKLIKLGKHNVDIRTPTFVVYTKLGSVPYLNKELVDQIFPENSIFHVPIGPWAQNLSILESFKEGVSQFSGLGNRPIYTSVQDTLLEYSAGQNNRHKVGVYGKSGKTKVDSELFCKLLCAIKPDVFQVLHDADTDKNSSVKRIQKSIYRNSHFFDGILECMKEVKSLENCGLVGAIGGGYEGDLRLSAAREMQSIPTVNGFSFEGFSRGGEEMNMSEIGPLLAPCLKDLQGGKPRILHGLFNPYNVMQAVELGIDILDSSYVHYITEKHEAFIFPTSLEKRAPSCIIALSNSKYANDVKPICKDCECYTCVHHQRAYLHHLHNTSELLLPILLQIHNFHHYLQFFKGIQQSIENNEFAAFKEKLSLNCTA